MILVDTSVWIEHLRSKDAALERLLCDAQVISHPFITGELAVGNLNPRDGILRALRQLPEATVARDEEVLHLISNHSLFGRGIGYVDAHLLAAVQLTSGASLWTGDKRLHEIATKLHLAWAGQRPHQPGLN